MRSVNGLGQPITPNPAAEAIRVAMAVSARAEKMAAEALRRAESATCPPGTTMIQSPGGGDYVGRIKQFSDWPELGAPLTADDYQGKGVTLKVTLGPGVLAGTATFKVPTTHKMVVKKIIAHLALDNPNDAAEALVLGGASVAQLGDVVGTRHIKAMNARMTLINADRQGEKIFDGDPLALSSLLDEPIDWTDMPLIVMKGQVLQLDIVLKDQDAAVVGANTEYGILLHANFIRVREG